MNFDPMTFLNGLAVIVVLALATPVALYFIATFPFVTDFKNYAQPRHESTAQQIIDRNKEAAKNKPICKKCYELWRPYAGVYNSVSLISMDDDRWEKLVNFFDGIYGYKK